MIPVDQLLECVTTAGNVSDDFLLSLRSALTPLVDTLPGLHRKNVC